MTEPWVSYYPYRAQQMKRSGRGDESYVFSKLVDDIEVVLMETSGSPMSELPQQ
jgi:hypothetical protein